MINRFLRVTKMGSLLETVACAQWLREDALPYTSSFAFLLDLLAAP